MVRQEIFGYLLTHYAISALICKAAAEAGIDPDRVKFKRHRQDRRPAVDHLPESKPGPRGQRFSRSRPGRRGRCTSSPATVPPSPPPWRPGVRGPWT
jgi:hypothetical protein